MSKQDEYQALREEIMHSQQEIKNYRNLLYTIVAAILVFAVEGGEKSILYLVPFVVIIPIFLAEMHQIDAMLRIGTYIYIFIEPNTECQWETRLYTYGKLHRNEYSTKNVSIDAYVMLSVCCITLSLLKLDFKKCDFNFYLTIVLQIIILGVCIYLFKTKRFDYSERKDKYIKEWKDIKALEIER